MLLNGKESVPTTAATPGTFQHLLDVASNLVDRSRECVGSLHSQVDRLVGGIPPDSTSEKAPKSVPNGFIEEMDDQLTVLTVLLSTLEKQIIRLAER